MRHAATDYSQGAVTRRRLTPPPKAFFLNASGSAAGVFSLGLDGGKPIIPEDDRDALINNALSKHSGSSFAF
jgi:hypothetical protein